MKKLVFASFVMAFVLFAKAQSSDPEMDYIKKTYSKDKKIIVSEYMNLNAQDSVNFWPGYESYEIGRKQFSSIRLNLINQYVSGYGNLTPEQINQLVKASFENNISQEKWNADSYEMMKKSMGPINSARWMQLEIYLQTMWRAIVQNNIPIIGALNK